MKISFCKKKFLLLSMVIVFSGCAGTTIFQNIPLTLDPLTLANPIAMTASATSKRLYVANSNNQVLWFDASFVILDISNPSAPIAIANISIPNFSGQMFIDEPRGYVYIPDRQSDDNSDTVDQVLRINIDETSPDFLKVEGFVSGDNPFGGFFDGTIDMFVASSLQAQRYDVSDFTKFTQVDLDVTTAQGRKLNSTDTRELMLSPSGNNVFVTNRSDSMLILNTAQFLAPTAPGKTDLGQEPVDYIVDGTSSTRGIARDSSFLYVVDGNPASLKIMTDAGLTQVIGAPQEITSGSLQVASIPVGSDPSEVIIDEPNRRAYVSNTGSDDVSVIDLDLQTEIDRVAVDNNLPANVDPGDQPFAMVLVNISGTNFLYVANFNSNNITVINADTHTVVSAFPDIDPVDDEEDNPS